MTIKARMSGGCVMIVKPVLREKKKLTRTKSPRLAKLMDKMLEDVAYEAVLQLEKEMIRMVPSPNVPNSSFVDLDPNHSLEDTASSASADPTYTDFDLGLLPSSDCDLDLPLSSPESSLPEYCLSPPSPSDQACLSPNLSSDFDCSSVTMFSPSGGHFDSKPVRSTSGGSGHFESPLRYVPSASPISLPPSSPYSPASRQMGRFSSTDSAKTSFSSTDSTKTSSSSSMNLKEDLSELAELQKIHCNTNVIGTQQKSLLKRALESYQVTAEDLVPEQIMDVGLEDTKLDFVLSMAMDHFQKEIRNQSAMLNINTNPSCWSQSEVGRWLRYKMQELKIPAASTQATLDWAANFEGPGFVQLTEEEFQARLPQGGDQIHGALDMWKNASSYNNSSSSADQEQAQQLPEAAAIYNSNAHDCIKDEFDIASVLDMLDNNEANFTEYSRPSCQQPQPQPPSFEAHMAAVAAASNAASSLNKAMPPIEELLQQEPVSTLPPPYPGSSSSSSSLTSTLTSTSTTTSMITLQPPMSHSSSLNEMTEDEEIEEMNQDETDVMSPVTAPAAAPEPIQQTRPAQVAPIRTSSNIHLWQFVKELLNQPQNHSGCIHWIDREQGIFKIVDSVRVAELWGRRKNRPAMNFDKLSRSLRQYYKKGIMKKTSRPQRLVYQFCTPYHL